jgi:hypothetical protein
MTEIRKTPDTRRRLLALLCGAHATAVCGVGAVQILVKWFPWGPVRWVRLWLSNAL